MVSLLLICGFLLIFSQSIFRSVETACTSNVPCSGQTRFQKIDDDVDETIREQERVLHGMATHFVGKIDVHGSRRHIGRKSWKGERFENPKMILWNGTVKIMRGITHADKPEQAAMPANIKDLAKNGKSCLKQHKQYPVSTGYYRVSMGPKEEGLCQDDFQPCSERKRGDKRQRDYMGKVTNRVKRSESYTFPTMLWKNPSRIPYAIDPGVVQEFRANIKIAISYWTSTTCINMVEIPATSAKNESYILFTSKGGSCSTDRIGPNSAPPYATTTDISLCGNLPGSIAHEIGHSLGLSHSQKRVDRDGSVKVIVPNIAPSWTNQFDMDSAQYFDEWGVPYYYDSIMHYFPYAATKNGLMTVCPLDPLMETVMGQREYPAFGDIALVNHIYCHESCYNKTQLNGLQFFGNKSRTISGRICQNWSTQMPHKHKFVTVGNHNSCRNPDGWDGGPWCYTTDTNVRYEPCFSSCEALNILNRPACNGWCYNGGFHNPFNCKCMCPPYTNGTWCETVNKTRLYAHLPCGGKRELINQGDKVYINSPNWPLDYGPASLCMWWIVAPNNTQIRLTISEFSMEIADQSGCYDYLEIRPSICATTVEKPDKMRFCGDSLSPGNGRSKELFSDDNNMVLKFFSDESDNGKGFSLVAEAVALGRVAG